MRIFPPVFSLVLFLSGPAFAHGGHVGELAGHTHWIGWAAVAGATAVAVWARKRRQKRDTDKAPEGASTAGEENKAQG